MGSEYRKLTRMANPVRATRRAELQEKAARPPPPGLASFRRGDGASGRLRESSPAENKTRARVSRQMAKAEMREVRPFDTEVSALRISRGMRAAWKAPVWWERASERAVDAQRQRVRRKGNRAKRRRG